MKDSVRLFATTSSAGRGQCRKQIIARVLIALLALTTGPAPLAAADFYWDSDGSAAGNNLDGTNLGGSGIWDLINSFWWDGVGTNSAWTNSFDNLAYFLGTPGTVDLGAGSISAGGLFFNSLQSGYTITGGTLTLGAPTGSPTPTINVGTVLNPFVSATISSVLAGSTGFVKTGNGTLFLTNNANSYTGDTVINAGTVIITNEAQLGLSSTTISINGIAQTGNPGFTGGQLVVNGASASGPVTMTREISMSGRGPGPVNASGGVVSVGNNIFNGDLVISGPASESRFLATHGTTIVNGDVFLGTGAPNYFLGGGNTIVNGQVSGFDTGTDRLIKTSGSYLFSTLWLTNANNDFRETIRPDSGSIRVSDNAALGTSTSVRAIDFASGGFLEIHTDTPNFETRNVYVRNNINGRIYATRAFDGSGLNQTIQFGNLTMEAGTLTFDNRNGYNLSINAADGPGGTTTWTSGSNAAFTNNADGRLTFDGSIRHSESTARTFSVGGNGNTLITGSYLGEGGAHNLNKNGNGILWLQGTASTYTGETNLNAGTLSIGSFGAINNNTAPLDFGATTVTAALEYTGAADTLTKTVRLTGTTGGGIILANGSGAMTIGGVSATGAGIKTLTLGGVNPDDNTVSGAIADNSGTNTTALAKFQAGTWLLSGTNTFTGGVTISDGTLKIQDTGGASNVIEDSNAITFDNHIYNYSAGGTFEYLGDGANASAETVGALTANAGAGTVKVTAGSGGTAVLTFSSLATPAAGSGINFVTNAGGSVVLAGSTNLNGILDAHLFYNGADFALNADPGVTDVVGAATYTTEAAGLSLAGANTTPYLVNTTDIAAQLSATINAGIKFDDTRNLTLGAGETLTLQNGAATVSGGILVTGGSTVTLSGGTGITSGGSAALVFRTDGAGDTLTLNTPILGSTTGGWTKLGAGTLILGAANANTTASSVDINEGTVQLTTGATLGADSVDVNLRQGATLDLNGQNLGTAGSGTGSLDFLNGAGAITNSAAATVSSLRVGNNNSSSLFTGTISDGAGQIALVKNGSSSFRIQGPQTFSGGVTINAGNYIVTSLADIGVASGLGTGDATDDDTNAASLVFNGGVLYYRGSDGTYYQPTDTPSVSINRLFTLAGNGTIYSDPRFGGPNRESVASGASLVFNNPGDVRFSGAGTRTLTLNGDSTGDNEMNLRLTNNPNLGEALSITKSGSSLWILTNTGNDYSGNTTINGGVLRVGDDGSALTRTLPTTSALVLGSGTGSGVLQTKGVFDRPLAATATAGSVTWGGTAGGGFAASTEPLVVNLGGAGATLKWNDAGFVPTGARLYLSSNTSWADVDFQHGIDLDGAARIIQVDDNGFTGLDYATISGNIIDTAGSGGGVNFTGGGNLILSGANTYTGHTNIQSSGTLIVTSIGNATGTVSSSIGASGGELRFTGNTTQNLMYVGAGETTDRPIRFTTALSGNRTYRIDSSGTGPLVLEDFANNTTGNFTLFMELRGNNTDANLINPVIGDGTSSTGLALYKADGGVWILGNTANTFTGGVRIDGGLLGLVGSGSLGGAGVVTTGSTSGSSTTLTVASTAGLKRGMYVRGNGISYGDYITAVGATTVTLSSARTVTAGTTLQFGGIGFSNGGIFTTDPAGITISQPMFLNNNTSAVFAGVNDITLDGPFHMATGNNDQIITNALENGATLTINGDLVNFKTNNRTVFMRGGVGENATVWNGVIRDAAANTTRFDIRVGDNATFTLGGDSKGAADGFTGGLVFGQGTLIVNHAGALGPVANVVELNGGTFTSAIDLTGANAIQNEVRLNGNQATIAGSQNIEIAGNLVNYNGNRYLLNELDPGKTLTISGNLNLSQNDTGRTLTIRGSGVTQITGVVQNGGAGNGSLAFSGLGSLVLTNAETATGALIVNRELVVLSGANGSWNNGTFTLNPTGIIRLDNSGGNNPSGRLSNAGSFAGNGGTLDIIGAAGGSSHSAGALTLNSVQTYITVDDTLGPVDLTFASANFANTGSSLNLVGVPSLGTTNKIIFTAALGANAEINDVMPRTIIGNDFADYDAVNGVKAFTAYNGSNNINTAAATDTMDLTASVALTNDRTINALKLNGTGLSVSGADETLTLGAAAILNTGGDNSLDVGLVQFGGNTGFIQVASGTTMDVNSVLIGTNGIAKTQAGTLNLNTPNFITSTTNVLSGTLNLNVALNTLREGQILNINNGATLDLNGNAQYTGYLNDPGVLPGTGGTITSSSGTGLLVVNQSSSTTVATQLTGDLDFAKLGSSSITLESVQSYTGKTTLMGGTLALQDEATISNTSAIEIRNATLYLNNNGSLQISHSDRVNDATTIALRDGTLNFTGKVQDMTTESIGVVSVFKGANTITVNTGGTGSGAIATARLTIDSLTRQPGTTINFTGTNLGSEGTNAKLLITNPLTPVGKGILGAWAIANTTDYAAYNQTNGVGVVGSGGYAGYDADFASGNITSLGMGASTDVTTTLPGGTSTTGLLRFHGGFVNELAFTNATDVLHLELGGILRSNNNNAASIGTPSVPGVITTGTSELITYNNQNTLTINSSIQGATALVKSGAGTLALTNANTYTLGTTVAQGTLRLEGGLFTTVIPAGGLQINNATVTMVTNNGQIDPTNVVTLTGSSVLTLAGGAGLDNTLDSLIFDNTAGTGTPSVNIPTGSVLTLTNAAPVTVTTNNAATLPQITGGTLAIGSGASTISVGAPNIDGRVYSTLRQSLYISSVISGPLGASITKTGDGLLELGGQSTFTGGINVTEGGLVLGASSTGTTANSLVSGPLGRGDLTMASGTRLFVDDSSRTVANAVGFADNPIFSNTGTSTDTMTLNGNLTFATLGTTGLVANIDTPFLNVVLGGKIQGIGSVTSIGGATGANTINKTGPGNISGLNLTGIGSAVPLTLDTLTNSNTFSLLHDGNGTSAFEDINLGTVTFDPVNGALMDLIIGRAGSGLYFATANNKRIVLDSLVSSTLNSGFRVRNNNNYGLVVPDDITLASGNLFTVDTPSTSLQVSGLELSGVISGTNDLIKAGDGTLKLTNASNSFTGTIDVQNGNIEGASDAVFGNLSNVIQLSADQTTNGLTISGTFATNRTINLNAANVGIDVTQGDTFTLNNPFTFTTSTHNLAKNYRGTLVLTAAQPGWDGDLILNQGVVSISDAATLGTTVGTVRFANLGSSLELNGGLTIADNFVFAPSDDVTSNGINGSGAVRSVTGVNILNGAITLNTATGTNDRSRAVTFTAASGATLEIAGVVTAAVGSSTNRDAWIGLGGEGNGILSTPMVLTGTPGTNRYFSITKFGSGRWDITAADAHPGTRVGIKEGILALSGAGTLGTPDSGQEATPTVYLNPTGVLLLDNSGTNVNNRLSGRALNVSGSDVNILGNNLAGTSETVGVFTLREGKSIFTLTADPGQSLDFTTGALTYSDGGTLLIRASNFGSASGAGVATMTIPNYTYPGQAGAVSTTNKGIIPWALGDTSLAGNGTGFVTSDTAANTGIAILRLLAPSEQTADFLTANANVNLSTAEYLSTITTFNSLRLDSGGAVNLQYVPLTLDSGGLLALSGNGGINGYSGVSYLTSSSNRQIVLHTLGDMTLNVPIADSSGQVTKSGPGTLTLTGGNVFTGRLNVDGGTLKLGGGDQTVFPGRSLQVNNGGTLDLNGTVQHFNLLESRQTAFIAQSDLFNAEAGGNVVNTGGSQATLALATANVTYTGVISDDIAVVRSQAAAAFQDWNLYSPQTYTGPTLLNGGRTQLLVEGSLLNTSSIEISNATLLLAASNATTDPQNITDLIGDTTPVTIRGGLLQFRSIANTFTTETLGDVTLLGGQNAIDAAEGGTPIDQADFYFNSLSRAANSRATVRFYNIDATPNDDARLFIAEIDGVPTTNIGDGLTNNIIGGWAVFEREFASYIPGMGVGGLNTTGFAGYSPNVLNEGLATDNIRIALPNAGLITTLEADRTIYTLNLNGGGSATDDSALDLGGYTLTLAGGGLILSNATDNHAISVLNGNLTAGALNVGGDLYLHTFGYVNGNTNTINRDVNILANIVDNGTGPVTLVINGDDGRGTGLGGLLDAEETVIRGNNTYSGGTFINAGRIVLNNPNADGVTITALGTGDVTISGGASTIGNDYREFTTDVLAVQSNQIANSATVTLLGGATLNLNNNDDTLAALVFNNTGGNTPTLTTGTGTLTLTGDITASGQNVSTNAFSTIAGKLLLDSATATITVNPVEWNGTVLNPILPNLNITASIEGTDIVKDGDGVLRLSGANGWAGNFDLQAGGLSLGNNSALSSGTLTIGDGTFLSSTADNRVIANDYTISGDFALSDIYSLTLNGATALAAGNHTITVDTTNKSLTLGGIVNGSGSITKAGDGILVLNNNSNSYTGSTTVNDGVLRYGVVDAIPTGSAVSVNEGSLLDITGGGDSVTVGSLAGDSATVGGVVYHGATSGSNILTAGGNNSSTNFGGVIANAAGSTLSFVKRGTGTMTLGGPNQYNGSTTVANGRLIARDVTGGSALGTSQELVMGSGATAGTLQLGDSSGPLDQTFTAISSKGTATTNQIVSGNASMATLTLDLAEISTFAGNIGGAGANEGNLNLVKDGPLSLVIHGSGTSTYSGSTTVSGGKLFMASTGAFPSLTTSLSVADGAQFALTGTSNAANQVYGFSGAGNVVTVGSVTGGTLGFGLDGAYNTRIQIATGQTLSAIGTLSTAIYVNGTPNAGQDYVLIDGVDASSLQAGGGTFDVNPYVFNGGAFTYALRSDNGIGGGGLDQWVLTPTAATAATDTWWKGDLSGLGLGVWSATLSGTSNWDDAVASGIDTQVAPDSGSIVHFSATGAANFDTTLGANMTIQELILHTGNAATTIGSSNGVNTLTLGNTVDTTGLTIETGAGNVAIGAVVALPQDQSWNIEDTARTLTLSGGLTGTSRTLTVNDATTNAGSLIFSGTAATMTGTLAMNDGTLVFDDTGSLNSGLDVVLGTGSTAVTLQLGNITGATEAVIGGLSNGSFAGSKVAGGNATISTLAFGPASGTATFTGALGGVGANENNFNLEKWGAGTQIIDGAATYSGTTIVREGTLQLGTSSTFTPAGNVSVYANAGATATLDFNGKNYTVVGDLMLGGGANGIAQFLDSAVTKGTITLPANIVFDATNDPGPAVIGVNIDASGSSSTITVGESVNAAADLTLNGTYLVTTNNGLTFSGPGSGVINGNIDINQATTGSSNRDVNFSSTGTWTINAKIETGDDININTGVINATVGESLDAKDDVVIDGTGTQGSVVVNISSTSQVHTGDLIYIRNGGHVNVTASGGIGTGTANLYIGDSASTTAGSAALLNLVGANISPGAILVGNGTNIGNITGTGTITTTGSKDLRNGAIEAGIILAGNGALYKQTSGTLVFSGERAIASTGSSNIREGDLILDYTTNNNSKIGGAMTLGYAAAATNASLILNGNASAPTVESNVTGTAITPGRTLVALNDAGQNVTLNLGPLTRTVAGGVVAFEYSSALAKATSTSPAGTLGWATVKTGAGLSRLAAIDGSGNIVQATLTTQNDPSLWLPGQDILVDDATTGLANCTTISTLTFSSSVASTVNIDPAGRLKITTGGILVDPALGAVDMKIMGSQLRGAVADTPGEIIVHQNNQLGSLIIGSNIVNSSGVTKTGLGTLVLSGNNSYLPTGSQVTINAGTIQVSGGNAIGDSTNLQIRAGASLDLANSTEIVGSILDESSGSIDLGTSGKLTINQRANADYRGVFTGGTNSVLTLNAINSTGTTTYNWNLTGTTTTAFTGTVVVNAGLLQLSSSTGRIANAKAFIINNDGVLLLDENSTSRSNARILDTATITLNSADGAFNGQTRPRGLAIRTDQDGTLDETVGVVTAASGANYLSLEATSTNDDSDIVVANLLRTNNATLNARGTNLGSTSAQNNQFRISNSTNQTAFINAMVGAGGAAGSKTISIVPWAIGETLAGALADTDMGDSLLTYVSGAGLRPLNLTTEYSTLAAAAANHNVRESLSANLTGLTTQTVNALVIHKNSTGAGTINVSGTGTGGQILTSTSGAFLFTQNTGAAASTAHTIVLDGFDGGIQVGGTEYVMHVVNPSSATNTPTLTTRIDSALNSVGASLTKAGRGTLELNAVNTFGGGTTVNEGALLVHDNDNLGAGGLTLAGGTLQLASDYADDLGTLPTAALNILSGGGTIDVLASNVTATGLTISGSGPLTKIGTGTLQLAGTADSAFVGDFNVRRGTLELNNSSGDAIGGGNLYIGFSTVTNETGTVKLLADNQIDDSTNVIVRSATTGAVGTLDLNGQADTIASLNASAVTGSGVMVRTGANGVLTVNGDITLSNDRNTNDAGTTARGVLITGTGTTSTPAPDTGVLDLGGGDRTIRVEPNNLTVPTDVGKPDATIETVIQNGAITKEGSRVLHLTGTNTYAGSTTINDGTVSISKSENLGDGSATNTLAINNNATLQATGDVVIDLGTNRTVMLGSDGGTFEVLGSTSLGVSGIVSNALGHDDCSILTKTGTGTLELSGNNTYAGATLVNEGILAISDSNALGGTTNGTSVAPGATLALSNDITVSGEALSLTAGAGGEAILTSSSGSNTWTGDLTVDTGADASNRVRILSDAGSNLLVSGNVNLNAGTQDFVIGGDGDGEISGTISGSQRLFKSSLGAGTWTLSADNSATFTGRTSVGNGTLQVSSEANLGATPGAYVANQLTLGGGSAMGTLRTTGDMSLSANRGVTLGTNGGAFSPDVATTLTVESIVTGGGALTKNGDGTVILNGVNDYAGATAVSGGTLLVDGSTAAGSNFTVGNGTPDDTITLGGTGTIGGSVTAEGGRLTAGTDSGIGTLTIDGTVSANSSSTWLVNLIYDNAPVSGTHVDLISGATLNPTNFTLVIDESDPGPGYATGRTYVFANYTGWTNTDLFTFGGSPLADGAYVWGSLGGQYLIDYDYASNSFALISAIPEPEAWLPALLVLALGLFLRRRRRRGGAFQTRN